MPVPRRPEVPERRRALAASLASIPLLLVSSALADDPPKESTAETERAADATASLDLGVRFTLDAGLFNLLDERYWEWGDVQGASRSSAVLDCYSSPGAARRHAGASVSEA